MRTCDYTSPDNYFEDFTVGQVIQHARGKTVGEIDNVLITNLVMNTAQAHLNAHMMADTPFGKRLSYGGVNAALVMGLASQDTSENAIMDLGLDKMRFKAPVFHGDTLYAYSEVLEISDADRADAGVVRFKHWGVNHNDQIVFEGERRVLIKRRSHWGDK
jgi:itaconyl-CoA hydratase